MEEINIHLSHSNISSSPIKKLIRKYLIIILLVIIPFFIFTYRLDKNPPGFFIDESIYGYEAYHILNTKGYSSSGEFLPRLILNPGDSTRNHSFFVYFVIPFIKFFGVNEFSVRLTSVFISIALITLIYFFLRKRISNTAILLAVFWWPITSWVFLLSRIGMEFSACALVYMFTIFMIVKIHDSEKRFNFFYIFVLSLSLGILFYIYAAGKLLAVGLFNFALIMLLRKRDSPSGIYMLVIIFQMVLLLSFSYILDSSFFYRMDELKTCKGSQNQCFIKNIESHLSILSYFKNDYVPPDYQVLTHSILGTSLLPYFLIPVLLLGLISSLVKIYKRDFITIILAFSFLLGMLPASLTIRGFDSYRSAMLLPVIFIFIIYGFDLLVKLFARISSKSLYLEILFVLIFSMVIVGQIELQSEFNYEKQTAVGTNSGWQYGYRQIFNYFVSHYQEYDKFIVTDKIAFLPRLYIRFFDPKQQYKKIKVATSSLDNVDLQKYYSGKVLIAGRPEEISLNIFRLKSIVYYPNNENIAYYIGEFPLNKPNK